VACERMVRLSNSLAKRVGDAMSVERSYSVAVWAWWAMPSRAGWAIEPHS